MTKSLLAVCLTTLWIGLFAGAVAAQDDRIFLVNGTKVDGVKVTSWDIRDLRYTKGSTPQSVATDQVAKVELARFKDTYRRGERNADLMLTVAREQQKEGNPVLAQLGFVGASARFFDSGRPQEAVGALDELEKGMPEAGVLPEVYRQKFEYYMGLGAKGAQSAMTVAKKYQAAAVGGAWPAGLAVEAEFFLALAERVGGGNPTEYQNRLRSVIGKAGGTNRTIQNRANVQLAHSLRDQNDKPGARKIYEDMPFPKGRPAAERRFSADPRYRSTGNRRPRDPISVATFRSRSPPFPRVRGACPVSRSAGRRPRRTRAGPCSIAPRP
jgi:hypothetical protein